MAGMQQDGISSREGHLRGVFSCQVVTKIGTGTTSRKTIQKTNFYVDQDEDGTIYTQPLNRNCVPSGKREEISKEDLLRRFTPEPEFYLSTVQPRMKEMNETINRADEHREKGEGYSAAFEYGNALKLDEDSIRANFGIGLCYLQRGETAKAEDILKRIVGLDAAFESEHKHLFNDFGISLRRSGLFDQAIGYYQRALNFSQSDDHLLYNLARAYMEKGDKEMAAQTLDQCLALNPSLEPALKMREALLGGPAAA